MLSTPWNHRAVVVCLAVAPCLGACGGAAAQNVGRTTTVSRPTGTEAVAMRSAAATSDAESLDDPEILRAVLRRIGRDEAIPAATVTVTVENGIVTLRGTVDHVPAARRAVDAAARTRGVRRVADEIDVRPTRRHDDELRSEILQVLATHAALDDLPIAVDVSQGEVALAGEVRSLAEAALAVETVESVRGVRGVESALEVVPPEPVSDERIASTILDRLRADARIDGALVQARVEGGAVRLEGSVASEAERLLAAELARVPGARSVENRGLRIEWWRREMMDGGRRPTDANVVAAIRQAIELDPRIGENRLAVRVDEGRATLTGTVPSVAAGAAAVEDVENVVGVISVEPEITVVPDVQAPDVELESRVSAALDASPWIREPIDVSVRDGRVLLRGSVDREIAAEEAERIAASVSGIRAVDDRVEVSAETLDEDWELAEEVESSLGWNPYIGRMNVAVAVDDGVVTLRGSVDDLRALREAEREARAAGATDVRNELEVRRPVTPRPIPSSSAPSRPTPSRDAPPSDGAPLRR